MGGYFSQRVRKRTASFECSDRVHSKQRIPASKKEHFECGMLPPTEESVMVRPCQILGINIRDSSACFSLLYNYGFDIYCFPKPRIYLEDDATEKIP